jgi:glycosyltransferase involved in cell wall biosynthesis
MRKRFRGLRLAIFHMGFFYSGGGERTAINQAIELEKRGHRVTCFAPVVRPEDSFPELIKRIDVKGYIAPVPISFPFRDAASLLASSVLAPVFHRKFAAFDAFICHGQPSTWIGYCLSRILKKPYVCYMHQPTRFLYPRPIDLEVGWGVNPSLRAMNFLTAKIGRPAAKRIDMTSVAGAQALLANSVWTAKSIEEFYGRRPTVCYPGVDNQFLKKSRTIPRGPKGKMREPFILSANRHYPQKRLEWLIQIFDIVHSGLKEAKLILTGSPTRYTGQLIKLTSELGLGQSVVFTGEVDEDELVRLYTGAEVCAYCAPEEDLGLGPLEAGACRTPSVVWNHAGPAETVVHGVTGFRAQPYDMKDFANKVSVIMSDRKLRERFGSNAFEYVTERFTWDNHIDLLEEKLEALA